MENRMVQIAPSLKILMITPGYYPSQGGVQVEIRLLVNDLVKKGYQITLITKEIPNTQTNENLNGVHIIRLPDSKITLDPWNGLFFIRKNSVELKKIIENEKIDIIHVHHIDLSCPYVYLLKKMFRLPIISTVHGSLLIDREYCKLRINFKEPFRWLLRILPILWFDTKSIQASDYLITVSKNLEDLCKSLRKDDHIITIPNAINLQQFNPDIQPEKFEIEGFKILCPGRISPEKGQLYLVDALKIVREKIPAQVIFMGSEHANMLPMLKKRIHLLQLDEFVHFLPAQQYESIPGYYKAADLVVIPSLSESFGLAILENMALGNVVVASNVGGIPDLIEDKKTGLLVPPANPQLLAEAIILALTDAQLRETIKKNAIEKAQEYDIQTIARDVERCYRKTLNLG
jgi:glycosyltransferase involved in cell wall biosynthesis